MSLINSVDSSEQIRVCESGRAECCLVDKDETIKAVQIYNSQAADMIMHICDVINDCANMMGWVYDLLQRHKDRQCGLLKEALP